MASALTLEDYLGGLEAMRRNREHADACSTTWTCS